MNRFLQRHRELSEEIGVKREMIKWFMENNAQWLAKQIEKDIDRMLFIQLYCETKSLQLFPDESHFLILKSKA